MRGFDNVRVRRLPYHLAMSVARTPGSVAWPVARRDPP
jgi:hypothetical protein